MNLKKTAFSSIAAVAALSLAAFALLSCSTSGITASKQRVLPFQEGHGLAGAYIGAFDNSTAIIAGGSDFETLRPWEGGTKSFFSDIYVLRADEKGYECTVSAAVLPEKMGNGCGVMSDGALYCLGGLTPSGYSPAVVRLTLSGQECSAVQVGTLPDGFHANAAASWEGGIYVHGSIEGENALYRLDPQSMQWTVLTPCPGRLLEEGSTFTPQSNGKEYALYLIGGRGTDDAGLYIATNVWEYQPLSDSWVKKADFCDGDCPVELMYTASIPYGASRVLSFGCDDGVEFRRRIELMALGDRQDELTDAFVNHPGFSDRIWSYDAATDVWSVIGTAGFPLPAVTTAIMLGGKVQLISGEEHPGVRNSALVELVIRD